MSSIDTNIVSPLTAYSRRAAGVNGNAVRVARSSTRQIASPISMRAITAKLKPAPCALHWMPSGVVDQMRMTPR